MSGVPPGWQVTRFTAGESSPRGGDLLGASCVCLGMETHSDLGFLCPRWRLRSGSRGHGSLDAWCQRLLPTPPPPRCNHIRCLAMGVGSAAPPWGEAGIVFSMAGCGKITHTEPSKQTGPLPWELRVAGSGQRRPGEEAVARPRLTSEPGVCQQEPGGLRGGRGGLQPQQCPKVAQGGGQGPGQHPPLGSPSQRGRQRSSGVDFEPAFGGSLGDTPQPPSSRPRP